MITLAGRLKVKSALNWLAVLALLAWAIVHFPFEFDLRNSFLEPFKRWFYPLGSDQNGRDLVAHFFWGGLLTLGLALPARLTTLLLAVAFNLMLLLLPRLEELFSMLAGLFLTVPSILLGIILASLSENSIWGLFAALVLAEWAYSYMTLRGQVLEIESSTYYQAARLLGGDRLHLFRRHIYPGTRPFLNNLFFTGLSGTIMTLSIISFLGLGIRDLAGISDWGSQIAFARDYMLDFPLMAFLPALGIYLSVRFFSRAGSN